MHSVSPAARQVYALLADRILIDENTPTISEISFELKLSTRKVLSALRELEDSLIIKRLPYRTRSIEIISELDQETGVVTENHIKIPILGTAPGGPLLMAEQNFEGEISVPSRLVKGKTGLFLLRVTGNSMSPYLEDGDLALIKEQNIANEGEIVVAVTENASSEYEATIKEFFIHGNQIILNPINKKDFSPIVMPRNSIIIQGVVVGAIKSFVD